MSVTAQTRVHAPAAGARPQAGTVDVGSSRGQGQFWSGLGRKGSVASEPR